MWETHWEQYNRIRRAGNKKAANHLLAAFIDLVKSQPEYRRAAIAQAICHQVLNKSDDRYPNNGEWVSNQQYRIQHTLFKEVLVPELVKGFYSQNPLHLRWIGQLQEFFYNDYHLTKAFLKAIGRDDFFEVRYFFERSYQLEDNQATLSLLLKTLARKISFYLHELPETVLTTPKTLSSIVIDFDAYCQQSQDLQQWNDCLVLWQAIARCWEKYEQQGRQTRCFSEFLACSEPIVASLYV